MDIESLITPVPKDTKPLPLAQGQFEFMIDRVGRKVAHPVVHFLAKKELVRVQTQRSYQLTLSLDLPDATSGLVRPIACQVIVDGSIDNRPEAARAFVETALQADFDLPALVRRLLEHAVAEFGATLKPPAAFVRELRTAQGSDLLQAQLVEALNQAHLGAKRLVLQPLSSDVRTHITLEDESNTLEIRPQDQLRVQHVGYRVRLQWGKDEEQVLGRLSYRGKIEGREPGSTSSSALVSGQIEPLEVWFRILLSEALSQQDWQDICSEDTDTLDRVIQAVSKPLGRGTGRIVQTLKVYPALSTNGAPVESSWSFRKFYPIGGINEPGLSVEHAIRYTLEERGRWEACNSPDPQVFLEQQVVEATRLFLLNMRFKDVVTLYLKGPAGEEELGTAIQKHVAAAAHSIGYRFTPVTTILTIPHMDFVHERRLAFSERTYALATAHVAPTLTIHATVRMRPTSDSSTVFARALAHEGDFDERVRSVIEDIVRSRLRGIEALQYYASHYVNGVGVVQNAETGEWVSLSSSDRQFQLDMRKVIDEALVSRFGLETLEFDLVPGSDRLISRMFQLSRLPFTHEENLAFERDGSSRTTIKIHAHATLFVASIDTQQWDSFYANAMRLTDEEHRNKIVETLHEVLKLLEGLVLEGGSAGLNKISTKELIVQWFTHRMSTELGLVVHLRPLVLRIQRPRVGRVAGMIVESLEDELRRLLSLRATIEDQPVQGYVRTQTRESLTTRIKQVRDELKDAAVEHESDMADAERVLVEQHPITGTLLEVLPEKDLSR